MILTDGEIMRAIEDGEIVVSPFDRKCLGTNSYDVHLGDTLAVYTSRVLDSRRKNEVKIIKIPSEGLVLKPNELYLGVTKEYTETHSFVPFIEGKSSVGRLGIDIHATAGKGDIGFCNHWTLEISVKRPVRIYPGMPIGQLIYFRVAARALVPYNKKESAHYTAYSDVPVASNLWRSFHGR